MNWLKKICDIHNTSIYQVSKTSGVADSSLYNFNNRYIDDLKLSDCEVIAKTLGLSVDDFIVKYYNEYKKR